jgi:hypothetical protein
MRVKLSHIAGALKARHAKPKGLALKARSSKAQGEGCEAAGTLGRDAGNISPEGATQLRSFAASPFQSSFSLMLLPGLEPWALLHRAFSARNIASWLDAHALRGPRRSAVRDCVSLPITPLTWSAAMKFKDSFYALDEECNGEI